VFRCKPTRCRGQKSQVLCLLDRVLANCHHRVGRGAGSKPNVTSVPRTEAEQQLEITSDSRKNRVLERKKITHIDITRVYDLFVFYNLNGSSIPSRQVYVKM